MKGKNITIFGLGAIGGFIGGNVFAFYKMLHSKRIRKALTDIVAEYGWLDLKDAKVIDSMDGYKISLPKVLILN